MSKYGRGMALQGTAGGDWSAMVRTAELGRGKERLAWSTEGNGARQGNAGLEDLGGQGMSWHGLAGMKKSEYLCDKTFVGTASSCEDKSLKYFNPELQ